MSLCIREAARMVPQPLDQSIIDEVMNRPHEKIEPVRNPNEKLEALLNNSQIFEVENYSRALNEAMGYAKDGGFIATAPLLIAAAATSDDTAFWEEKITVLSERHYGKIPSRKDHTKLEYAMVFIHGGGLFTPENMRLVSDFNEQLSEIEIGGNMPNLVKGILPNGDSIEIYSIDDVKKGNVRDPFGRYGIIVNNDEIAMQGKGESDKMDSLERFMNNPYILANAGTPEYLERIFAKTGKSTFLSLYELSDSPVVKYVQDSGFTISCALNLLFWASTAHYCGQTKFSWGHFIAARPEGP